MNGKLIRVSKSSVSDFEKKAVLDVLDKEHLGMGHEVKLFEEDLVSYLGSSLDVVCVNTGTSALHLSLAALGVGVGDEVLVPALTYVATFQAISATGAEPIACDVKENTGFIDLNDAALRMSSKVKAIMPVHYASDFRSMEKVYAFSREHNLRVIEDAAHSFGGTYTNGDKISKQADIVCYSFDGIKNITSGEGGAIVSSDLNLIQKLKDMRLLGVEKDTDKRYSGQRSWEFDVKLQGFRYHMSNIMAAIGRAQLSKIDVFIEKRKDIMERYLQHLQLSSIDFFDFDYVNIVPHIFVIKVKDRDELRAYLLNKKIETGLHYQPNHLLTKYKSHYNLPVTESLASNVITLPCHNDLSIDEQNYIISSIKEFYDDI